MLSNRQQKFRGDFLNPFKQRFFFWRQLPMALLAGVRLIELDEEKAIATVPFKPRNKNPFKSMYFAVQSMAAELSTAATALLALKALEGDYAYIIVKNKAQFSKKAASTITFTCVDYRVYMDALNELKEVGDATEVTAKTMGVDENGDQVSEFWFTWSFKRKG